MASPDMVAVCKAYQALGWHVFPVNGKQPATTHGFKDASLDNRLAGIWYGQFPTRGIALATGRPSGVWVLDIDGPEGEDALNALALDHGDLPETVEAMTGKGRHLYFLMPPDRDIRNSASQVGERIDVRGTGGYVVLPPSPHPSGDSYRWATGKKPGRIAIAAPPAWLLDLVTAQPTDPQTGERMVVPDEIPEGQRDTTIFKLGCSLRARGLSEEAIFAALLIENRDRCKPPLTEREVRDKAKQAALYAPGTLPPSKPTGNGKGTQGEPEPERGARPQEPEPVKPTEAFLLLRELLERPELLEPPEPVVDRFVWRGRTTGLIGPDKSGKSTLAAHMVAALTTGSQWLDGGFLEPGTAVIAAPDEAVGDTVRRIHELGADPDGVRILALHPPDLLLSLDGLLKDHPADMVIIDSLAEWARLSMGQAPDDGDAAGWGAVVRPIVSISHRRDTGILLLHHPRRSDGQYRGSGEIAAALDCLLEMKVGESGEDDTLRRFKGRARWPVEDFTIRLNTEAKKWELSGGGQISLDARVLAFVRMNPGKNFTACHDALGGRKVTLGSVLNQMIQSGMIVEQKSGRSKTYYLPDDLPSEMRF